jgi:ubiquinone/menaquinone biosynthesis C-methylase UbiE
VRPGRGVLALLAPVSPPGDTSEYVRVPARPLSRDVRGVAVAPLMSDATRSLEEAPVSRARSRYRIRYYDLFSRVYDRFVAAHSSDREGHLREDLADRAALRPGGRALDLCTGTGAMLPGLSRRLGTQGLAVGLDFSRGMLAQARRKLADQSSVVFVEADAERLPFRDGSFDAVTCSHAFYELRGSGAERALVEVGRALRPAGRFVMMEHEVPERWLIRLLFYVRLLSMGLRKALEVLGHEEQLFRRHFEIVERTTVSGGRSKIILGLGAAAPRAGSSGTRGNRLIR